MTVPAPTRTHRDTAYELLREAGNEGVSYGTLRRAGVVNVSAHLESLRFEGHAIEEELMPARHGGLERAARLERDAWA